jgi:DNA-binding transcriptional MerR regulator
VNGHLTISEIARKVGVSAKTLVRWEKTGKIRKAKRDWKGWRVYLEDDLAKIQNFVSSVYDPEEIA